MYKLLAGLAALPLFTGVALAANPNHKIALSDQQMDAVTAGAATSGDLSLLPARGTVYPSYGLLLFVVNEADVTNTGTVIVSESGVPCANCYLAAGPENLVVQAAFGP
jgi:hypothetical protein